MSDAKHGIRPQAWTLAGAEGSTAIIGGYIIAGTSAVDIGGDIGLYIYGRNR